MSELNAVTSKTSWTNGQNDALSEITAGWNTSRPIKTIQDKKGYYDWGEDYLWLPSWVEVGCVHTSTWNTSTPGLWNMDTASRGSSANYAFRSGIHDDTQIFYLDSSGYLQYATTDSTFAVRPALHLNLAAAEEQSIAILESPTATYHKTYSGDVQTVEDGQSWYNSALFGPTGSGKLVNVSYYDENNVNPVSTVKDSGTYTVRFRITDASKTNWADANSASDVERTCKFTIDKKAVKFTLTMRETILGDPLSVIPVAEPDLEDIYASDKSGDGSAPSGFSRLRYKNDTGTELYDDIKYPKKQGWYIASAEVLHKNYTVNKSESTGNNELRFQVTARRVQVPLFTNDGGDSQVYSGGNRTFVLDYDSEEIEITIPTEMVGKMTMTGGELVTARESGEYYLNLHLKDNTGSAIWYDSANSNDRQLKFSITKYEVIIDVIEEGEGKVNSVYGKDKEISIEIARNPLGSDEIEIEVMAAMGSMKPIKIGSISGIDKDSDVKTVTLGTNALAGGEWNLTLSTGADNYTVSLLEERKLVVKEEQGDSGLTWRLYQGKTYKNKSVKAEITEGNVRYTEIITYDGKEYSFKLNRAPSGYVIDEAYNEDGYKKGYRVLEEESNSPIEGEIKNAGKYKTQVRLLEEKDNSVVVICEISWEIGKAKYDLTDVKWKNNGEMEYDGGNEVEAVLENVPKGLKAVYLNNKGKNVGDPISASVTFELEEGYEKNYVLPEENEEGTYKENSNSPFEWSKTCRIVAAEIKTGGWKNKSVTDSNGKAFDVLILRDPRAVNGVVEYEYYETDSTGKIKDPTKPLKESELKWSGEESKYYVAKIVLTDRNNYELENPEAVSKVFRIGKDLTKVQVSIEKSEMEYNGNPRHAKVKTEEGIPTNAFEVTYYEGYAKLATAPTNVGKYRV